MDARILITMLVTSIAVPAFAQTLPTAPSAYPTMPTFPSAFATAPLSPCFPSYRYFQRAVSRGYVGRLPGYFNPESPCYSGTIYPAYSAVAPSEYRPGPRTESPGAEKLDESEARQRIEAKGYLDVSSLEQDRRGIWRGKATMEDGRPVNVTVDLEGNIYSTPSRLHIRIEPPPSNR
jgi:hypothetical protein